MNLRNSILCLLAAGTTVSCGKLEDPCVGGIFVEDLLECIVEARCMAHIQCRGDEFNSVDECTTAGASRGSTRSLKTEIRRRVDAVKSNHLTYDIALAQQCYDTTVHACTPTVGLPEVCSQVFSAPTTTGDTCFFEEQCEATGEKCMDPLDCDRNQQCCPRRCIAPLPLGNTGCDVGFCEDDALCVHDTCESGEQGSPCEQHNHCDHGFFCGLAAPKSCVPSFELDSACTEDRHCISNQCVGNRCALVEKENDPCQTGCPGWLWCDRGELVAVCRALPSLGENCSQIQRCQGSAWCKEGVCIAPSPAGTACEASDDECEHGTFCSALLSGDQGTCNPPQSNNALCKAEAHCVSETCADNGSGETTCQDYENCTEGL